MPPDVSLDQARTDAELLRRYALERNDAAFTELVRRRVDLVYSVALRKCGGDGHLAEDVTQKVFVDLARKAAELSQRAAVSGWLFRSAQFAASDVVRSERRRRGREQESQTMHEISTTAENPAHWEQLRPLLDEALGELGEADRDAVALRFFEDRAFADIGRALRLTEEAARKRVDRALDKLAGILAGRGVTSTGAALGLALGSQALTAAPAGLAATVSGAALTAGTTAAVAAGAAMATGAGAMGGWVAFMSSTKVAASLGAAAILAAGAAFHHHGEANRAEAALTAVTHEHAATRAKLGDLEGRLQAAERRAETAEADAVKLQATVSATKREAIIVAPPPSSPPAAAPITRDTVEARYRRAQELARSGDRETALAEFLWCFDEGMPAVSSYTGVRLSFLLGEIEKIGPAGLAALRERRDVAQKRLLAGAAEFQVVQDFAALNRTLKEEDLSIAIYDALPADDPRQAALARVLYEPLVALRRYGDAARARSYAQMARLFEMNAVERPLPGNTRDPERMRQMHRDYAIKTAAKDIEVLAGSGDAANARGLARRLLAYDGSDATRAVLREHLQRAGHLDLLSTSQP